MSDLLSAAYGAFGHCPKCGSDDVTPSTEKFHVAGKCVPAPEHGKSRDGTTPQPGETVFIGKGERLVLTGYDDVLHVRLESFIADGWRPQKYIERKITWEMLTSAAFDVLPHTIGGMREKLAALAAEPEQERTL